MSNIQLYEFIVICVILDPDCSGQIRVTSQHKATKKHIFENLCERPIEMHLSQM